MNQQRLIHVEPGNHYIPDVGWVYIPPEGFLFGISLVGSQEALRRRIYYQNGELHVGSTHS